MADLPTIGLGTHTSVNNTSVVGTEPVLQLIGSASDASYVHASTNVTGVYVARFTLADMPADFGNVDTLSVRLRFVQTGLDLNTWDSLTAQVFRSDGTTPLTDEATVAADITTTTATNSGVINFTGVDNSANKAVWDAAVVHISLAISKNKGGDTYSARVTAGEITGAYTVGAAGPIETTVTGSLASSGLIRRQTARRVTGQITLTGLLAKTVAKFLAGQVAAQGVADGVEPTPESFWIAGTTAGVSWIAGTTSPAEAVEQQQTVSGVIVLTGALSTAVVFARTVAGTATAAGTLIRQTAKQAVGSIASAGALIRSTTKSLLGSVTGAGAVATLKVLNRLIAGSLTASGMIARQTMKIAAGSLASAGAVIRQTAKLIAGSTAAVGDVARRVTRLLALAGSLVAAGSTATLKVLNRLITGSLTVAGSVTANAVLGQLIAGSLTVTGAISKMTARAVAGTAAFAGAVAKRTARLFAGAMTASGSAAVAAILLQTASGIVTALGSLARQFIAGTGAFVQRFFNLVNLMAQPAWRAKARLHALGAAIWARWRPTDKPDGYYATDWELKEEVFRAEADGAADWARWQPGASGEPEVPKSFPGTMQVDPDQMP